MEFDLSNYTEVAKRVFEYTSVIAAIVFAVWRQYHVRKQKKAEAEAAAFQAKVRELEVKHLLKKKEIDELRRKLERHQKRANKEEELRKKIEDRYNRLRRYLKIDKEFDR